MGSLGSPGRVGPGRNPEAPELRGPLGRGAGGSPDEAARPPSLDEFRV